jgi:ATP-binding cassette subfamily F protein 3
MHVYYQDKIAILGKNGCGKTTLLRALIGEQKLLNGSIQLGAALSVGYYDQLHINLGNADTVFNAIHSLVPTEPQGYVLGYLARFGFRGDAVEKPIAVLSGGEKARLYLARLIHQQPNFLILDEPTNHLDMEMIDSLEEALQHYDGTIIFVSHDRDFINRTATRRWYFDGTALRETDESLEALFRSKPETTVETKPAKQKINQTKVNPIVLQKKEAEIEALNQKLEDEEAQLHRLHMKLADKALYQNPAALQEVQQAIASIEAALPRLREELDTLELEYLEMLE